MATPAGSDRNALHVAQWVVKNDVNQLKAITKSAGERHQALIFFRRQYGFDTDGMTGKERRFDPRLDPFDGIDICIFRVELPLLENARRKKVWVDDPKTAPVDFGDRGLIRAAFS